MKMLQKGAGARGGHHRRRSVIRQAAPFLFSGVCFTLLAVLIFQCSTCYMAATRTDPSPGSAFTVRDPAGFPEVDWNYWQSINPQVIGWVTIPGTAVDYPIVQAPPNDPTFYLTHDVYGDWNFAGCPYLDAECADGGLEESMNAVVFGHNLGYGDPSLFAAFARYVDASFAQAHRTVLVQTPTSKIPCVVQGAACIQGDQASKRTRFSDEEDFHSWYQNQIEKCSCRTQDETEVKRTITFCTCSYYRWDNERTIVYAAPN